MADKFQKTYKVDFSFVDGEPPTAAKLNAWSKQISNALTLIEKAIGDLWDQSFPYFDSSKTLTQSIKKESGEEIGDQKSLEIVNLARLIGPSSALNPLHLSGLDLGDRVIKTEIGIDKTFVKLGYAPVSNTSLVFTETTPNSFIVRVTDPSILKDDGDYFIDENTGELFWITPTTETVPLAYTVQPNYDAYASYRGASHNIIPPNDQATKCSATGPDVDGLYLVTLPEITFQDTNDARTSTALTDRHINFEAQLKLPDVLSGALITGDVIPDGFLFVRDDTDGTLYRSATYYYENSTSLSVGGATLDTTHDFTVITVGTNITQSIQDLNLKLFRLRRGQDTYASLDINSIGGKEGTYNLLETDAEPYGPSDAPSNHFPQYLHRDGWLANYDDNNINDQNGLRGDLVVLSTTRKASGTRSHLDADSRRVYFGQYSTGPHLYVKDEGGPGTPSATFHINAPGAGTGDRLIILNGDSGGRTLLRRGLYTSSYNTDQGPFYFIKDELSFNAVSGVALNLSSNVVSVLSGKTIISVAAIARAVADSWVTCGAHGALDNNGFTINFDSTSPTTVTLYLENLAGWDVLGNNRLRLFITYTD